MAIKTDKEILFYSCCVIAIVHVTIIVLLIALFSRFGY